MAVVIIAVIILLVAAVEINWFGRGFVRVGGSLVRGRTDLIRPVPRGCACSACSAKLAEARDTRHEVRGSSLEAARRCLLQSWRCNCVQKRPTSFPDALATLWVALTTVRLNLVISLQRLPARA